MDFTATTTPTQHVTIENLLPRIGKEDLIRKIVAGLTCRPKYIPSVFFYDAAGSKLFERITHMAEYYPTRTEKALLWKLAPRLGNTIKDMDIVELGSGDCSKISILFDCIDGLAIDTIRYVPVDVSRKAIEESADVLTSIYPKLTVHGVVADFLTQLHLLPSGRKRLFCFLGSTIGNLTEEQQSSFLWTLAQLMRPSDSLLLGLDMVKPKEVLEKAYNDNAGITAAFNRNILKVVNGLSQTDFDPDAFDHVAFYNERDYRIEMHLEARKDMVITSPVIPSPIVVNRSERIHTENSHKFTPARITELIGAAGLETESILMDPNQWFSLVRACKLITAA